ncbi:MFS transporter [Paraburkholderia sp. EG287B]|uniref:MFS transporter n=1 Tax=Paraburkholderia sp. EG287B TaxID=3237010 RepID=UPI0034D2EF4A
MVQCIEVNRMVDEASFNGFHAKILVWCLLITIIDGCDLTVTGIALPSIMQQMGVSASTAGLMASSSLFGMMFGSIFLGALSEKIGRRWTISICIFLFSVFTAGAGFTGEPLSFSVLRFIAGLGIGGVMPNVIAQMTEYAPKKIRSLLTTVMYSGYAIGGVVAAVLGKVLIAEHGWQAVFIAAGPPVLLIPFVLKSMPESLSYLVARRDDRRLRAVVRRLQPGIRLEQRLDFRVSEEDRAVGVAVARLFQEGRGMSTVIFWIAIFNGLFMVYSLSTWLTKLMAMSGYSLGSALSFAIAMNIGAYVGGIGGGWLADKLHIKWVLVAMYALGSIFLCLMTVKVSTELLYVIIGAVGACSTGAQIVAYSYCGQFYPMPIRSTGVGVAVGVGRLGAIVAPPLIGQIVALKLPLEQNFLLIAAAGMLAAIALAFIDHSRSASNEQGIAALKAPPPAPVVRGHASD